MDLQAAQKDKYSVRVSEGFPDDYQAIFTRVFGYLDPYHVPAFTYVAYAGEHPVGFIAMYRKRLNEVHFQYAGIVPESRGLRTIGLLKEVVRNVEEIFHYITISIEAINIPALKIALAAGFVINGYHSSSLGVGYVDLMKEKGIKE